MTQPRNSRADRGGRGRAEAVGDARFLPPPTAPFRPLPPTGAVLASIPIANRSLLHPASAEGIPVTRSARASAYTSPESPGVVRAASAARAAQEGRRAVASSSRAAASP